MKWCIYETVNLLTGKIYRGQHSYKKNPNDGYLGSSPELKRDIKQFGKENFKKTILIYNINEENIDSVEVSFIKQVIEKGNTYNKHVMGTGASKHNPGAAKYMRNRFVSEETREKHRQSSLGNKRALGHVCSKEARKVMSEKAKNREPWTKEQRERQRVRVSSLRWFNNGTINVRKKECPEGFVEGRLRSFEI